eukprot:1162131-Pelagomonas_calceolata.AAC.13
MVPRPRGSVTEYTHPTHMQGNTLSLTHIHTSVHWHTIPGARCRALLLLHLPLPMLPAWRTRRQRLQGAPGLRWLVAAHPLATALGQNERQGLHDMWG